jgi:hypothetical protein
VAKGKRARALTAAERALVQRYSELEARSHRLANWILLPCALGMVIFGFIVMKRSGGVGFAICLMGVGLALLPQLIGRLTRAQVDDRVSKLRGVCSTRTAAKLGTLHFVGESQVYLPLGWDAFWPEGTHLETEVCRCNAAGSLLLLWLPEISAESEAQLPPLTQQGNGWAALSAILLAACIVAGSSLLGQAKSGHVLGALLYWRAQTEYASVAELLKQGEVPVGVEVEIADSYRLALWGESYLLDLRPDEHAAFSQLLQPATGEVQLAALQELVRAKRYDALPEQGERHEVGSLAPVEHVRGIISGYPNRFLFETGATSDTRSWAYFALSLVAFAFTTVLALRRHRQGVLELVARRQRLAALRQPTE